MEKKKCIKCGKELTLGAFAHNQDTCWDCFKDIILFSPILHSDILFLI